MRNFKRIPRNSFIILRNLLDKGDTRSKYSLTTHYSLLHLPCAIKKGNSIDGERRFAVKLRVVTRTTGEGWTGSSASP